MRCIGVFSMDLRNKKMKRIFSSWPAALILIGVLLSIAWLALLIWLPLHLFNVL